LKTTKENKMFISIDPIIYTKLRPTVYQI